MPMSLAPAPHSFQTLTSLLDHQAREIPNKLAFAYLPKPPSLDGQTLTYLELQARATELAASILERVSPGERVVLVYDCNLEYIVGFFACLYAGVIAVPVYPPTSPQHVGRLQSILSDCSPQLALTTQGLRPLCPASLPVVTNEEAQSSRASLRSLPSVWPDQIAFLQYTSGSTGQPKGVMLTHGNVTSNLTMIRQSFGLRSEDVQISWLPLYHDMGLIGGVLSAMAAGVSTYLLSPMTIVRPTKWLELVPKVRATIIGGPNFCIDLSCERVSDADLDRLDLSSVRMFFTGAEPIRLRTLERFSERFRTRGFDAKAFTPCYGLAEATVMISAVRAGDGVHLEKLPGSQQSHISNGRPAPGLTLKILGENGRVLPAGEVGEIVASGPNIGLGYWGRAELTQETFGLTIDGKTYLRTGDRGFVDGENRLYVTGRIKEMMIVRGRNYYPTDVEDVAKKALKEMGQTILAAFSIEHEDEEKAYLAVEVQVGTSQEQIGPAQARIIELVQSECGLGLSQVLFLRPGSIPRTSSGKIRRTACRGFIDGSRRSRTFRDDWRNTELYKKWRRRVKKASLAANYRAKRWVSDWRSTLPLPKRGISSTDTTSDGKR